MPDHNTVDHPILGTVRYTVTPVPDAGDGQTARVIELMARYAVEDSSSPEVLEAVRRAQEDLPGAEPEEQVFHYVRSRIRFVYDEVTALPLQSWYADPIIEALIRPRDMIASLPFAQGDCDDFSMLVAAMLMAQGVDVAYVTVAADPADPAQFSHVYVASYRDGRRIPVDASHGPRAGWEAETWYRKQEWPIGKMDAKQKMLTGAVLAAAFIGARYL